MLNYISYSKQDLKSRDKGKDYYKNFYIIVSDYLPSHILGMTDCKGRIWIKRLYGYLREKVLKHEILHNLFPEADEYEIRRLTETSLIDLSRFRLIFL